jgi:hypothetical protein
MAVGVVSDFEGATVDQYDEILQLLEMSSRDKAEPGRLFDWVTKTDLGFWVTDLWETREAFEEFSQERAGTYAKRSAFPIFQMSPSTGCTTT